MNAYEVLKERGFIEQLTHEEEIKALFEKAVSPSISASTPPQDSLHVGQFPDRYGYGAHAALRQPPHLPDGGGQA